MGAVVKPFGYWRDHLFLVATTGYILNRWLVNPLLPTPFLTGYFDDLLLIPAALPLVLWVQRRLQWRDHDRMPTGAEILLHLAVWSFVCEWLGPRWFGHGTADGWDVVAYAAGALVAYAWWQPGRLVLSGHQS